MMRLNVVNSNGPINGSLELYRLITSIVSFYRFFLSKIVFQHCFCVFVILNDNVFQQVCNYVSYYRCHNAIPFLACMLFCDFLFLQW